MNIFYHGDFSRVEKYCHNINGIKKFNLLCFFKPRPNDLVLNSRAWSPIIFLYYIISSKKRALVIQVADGLITHANNTKRENRSFKNLYGKIYADAMYVLQPFHSIPSGVSIEKIVSPPASAPVKKKSVCKEVFLCFGNDPFLNIERKTLLDEVSKTLNTLPDWVSIFFTCPNPVLYNYLRQTCPKAIDIGRFDQSNYDPSRALTISTPSTVALNLAKSGLPVLIANCFECHALSTLFLFYNNKNVQFQNNTIFVETLDFTTPTLTVAPSAIRKKQASFKECLFGILSLTPKRLAGDIKELFKK